MNKTDQIFAKGTSGLVKTFSWTDISLLAISAPAGSGIIYYSVSTASTYPGASIPLSFLIGMIIFLPIIFLAACSSVMIPRSGSLYVLISRVIDPALGYLAGFLLYVAYSLAAGVISYVAVGVIGGIIANFGEVSASTFLKSIGSVMQTTTWQLVISIAFLIIIWATILAGVHLFRNMMRLLFVITLGCTLITVVYFLFTSSSSAERLFDNTWGQGTFNNILNLAAQNGWNSPGFSWSQTISALLVVLWSFGGIEVISYASGEIGQVGRKVFTGYMIAWVALGLFYILVAYSILIPMEGFLGAYDFLYQNHSQLLGEIMTPIAPSIPFYLASLMPSHWFGILLALGISFWLLSTIIPYFFSPSRLIFALAMDRAIPEKMANVNKAGAPTWSTHVTIIIAILGVLFNVMNVEVVLGTLLFAAFFVFWLYGISAMLLPYRKPELYESCPIKTRMFGVPIYSVSGVLTFGIGWFVLFFTIRQMTLAVSITTAVIMAMGLLIYYVQYLKNRKKGIIIDKVYSEIPPA
ncbi:MAG: APC family permease [candidate division Zixibacteria bacterium]